MSITPLKTKTSIGFCVAASALAHLVFMVLAFQAPALAPEAFSADEDARVIVQIASIHQPVIIENAVLPEAWTMREAEPVEVAHADDTVDTSAVPSATEAPVVERSSAQRHSAPVAQSAAPAPRAVAPRDVTQQTQEAPTRVAVAATDEGSGPIDVAANVNPSDSAGADGDSPALAAAQTDHDAANPASSAQHALVNNRPTLINDQPELQGDDTHRELVARYAGRVRNVLGAPPVTAEIRQQQAAGTVLVRLLVDDRGRVIGLEVVDSSGDALLDANTLAWLQDRRLPRPPRDLRGAPVAFAVPVTYSAA